MSILLTAASHAVIAGTPTPLLSEAQLQSSGMVRAGVPHIRARTAAPEEYPVRFHVPEAMIRWTVPFPQYTPPYYVSPTVLAHDRSLDPSNPKLWADPEQFMIGETHLHSFEGPLQFDPATGHPRNVRGRTGISGRGLLGRWGPNFAVDPIVTRTHPRSGELQLLVINRGDTGRVALPGGIVDSTDRTLAEAMSRELLEETSLRVDMGDAVIVYQGYCDDRRNTDNAWFEITAAHKHMAPALADTLQPEARDDAAPGSARWESITDALLQAFIPTHAYVVRLALMQFQRGASQNSFPK